MFHGTVDGPLDQRARHERPRGIVNHDDLGAWRHRTKRVGHRILSTLASFDDEQDAVMIIKWKEILDFLEDATDRCEDVANLLEGVVVKNA